MATNFQLHPYTVESDVSLFAPIKQPTYDFTAYTHPDLDDADEKLKKHDYKSIISAYEKYFESPIFERDGRGREYYYYVIACRDLAIKDRTASQSIRLFEHACAVDSKVDLRLAALYDLDTTIEANKMQARSFKDRMSLARKAASENDLRAAVLEATIALTIKNDESARGLLRHWRKQLEQKRVTPGIERTLPLMEELLLLKRRVRVGNSNSTNYSLQKNIEDLTLGYLNNSDYAKAYDTYSSLAKLTGFNPEFNYYYRTLADIALRDGNIQGAIKNLKAEISAEHKNTKEDQRSYKSLGECYMNYALVLALSAQYDAAAQAIKDAKAAFEKSASDGDAFDSTSCGVGPGADLNLDL